MLGRIGLALLGSYTAQDVGGAVQATFCHAADVSLAASGGVFGERSLNTGILMEDEAAFAAAAQSGFFLARNHTYPVGSLRDSHRDWGQRVFIGSTSKGNCTAGLNTYSSLMNKYCMSIHWGYPLKQAAKEFAEGSVREKVLVTCDGEAVTLEAWSGGEKVATLSQPMTPAIPYPGAGAEFRIALPARHKGADVSFDFAGSTYRNAAVGLQASCFPLREVGGTGAALFNTFDKTLEEL